MPVGNVLITSAGRRGALIRNFQSSAAGFDTRPEIHAIDADSTLSAACRLADRCASSPRADSPDYAEFLRHYCGTNGISLVIPTNDTELAALASLKPAFAEHGTTLLVSSPDLIERCGNKIESKSLFESLDFSYPELLDIAALRFPCFMKPLRGSSSIGARRIDSARELSDADREDASMMFMELVPAHLDEYTVDCYFDRQHGLRCVVPRRRLAVRAGEVSKGITAGEAITRHVRERIGRLQGAVGCITLQLFSDPLAQETVAIEINPRFGGGYPLAYDAGADFPRSLMLEYVFDLPAAIGPDYEEGLVMLRYDAHVIVKE